MYCRGDYRVARGKAHVTAGYFVFHAAAVETAIADAAVAQAQYFEVLQGFFVAPEYFLGGGQVELGLQVLTGIALVELLKKPQGFLILRSEERRVGKECRCGW